MEDLSATCDDIVQAETILLMCGFKRNQEMMKESISYVTGLVNTKDKLIMVFGYFKEYCYYE